MPKCTSGGCDQTAFYGSVFNQPRFCKSHAPPGSGSVKKKCAGECSNAVFVAGVDLCQRCAIVNAKIAEFRKARLDELDAAIKKENLALAQQAATPSIPAHVSAGSQPTAVVAAHVRKPSAKPLVEPATKPLVEPANMFAVAAAPKPAQVVNRPKASGAPKIVRIPEETSKPASLDLALAKKRAQTPGRPRSSSAGEIKLPM